MYGSFFEMANTPFVRNIPADRLYTSKKIEEAIGRLKYTVDNKLDVSEIHGYIAAHLAYAGCKQELFTSDAEEEIYKISGGIFREINAICEKSLLYAFQNQKRLIDGHMIRYVAEGEMLRADENMIA